MLQSYYSLESALADSQLYDPVDLSTDHQQKIQDHEENYAGQAMTQLFAAACLADQSRILSNIPALASV